MGVKYCETVQMLQSVQADYSLIHKNTGPRKNSIARSRVFKRTRCASECRGERRLLNTQKYLLYFVLYVVPCHSGAQFHGQLKTSKMKTHIVAAAEISSI